MPEHVRSGHACSGRVGSIRRSTQAAAQLLPPARPDRGRGSRRGAARASACHRCAAQTLNRDGASSGNTNVRSSKTASGSALRVALSTPYSTIVEQIAITISRTMAIGQVAAGGIIARQYEGSPGSRRRRARRRPGRARGGRPQGRPIQRCRPERLVLVHSFSIGQTWQKLEVGWHRAPARVPCVGILRRVGTQ